MELSQRNRKARKNRKKGGTWQQEYAWPRGGCRRVEVGAEFIFVTGGQKEKINEPKRALSYRFSARISRRLMSTRGYVTTIIRGGRPRNRFKLNV